MSVGLDIGSKTIKMVELAEEGSGWRLKASGIVGLGATPPERTDNQKELGQIAENIKKLKKEAKISSKEVVISLPEPQVYTRPVKFPLLTDSEIASAVKWEAEQYVPIPVEDAIIQHQIIEKREDTAPPQAMVLLIAAPKVLVKKYAEIVDMAGLKLVAAETDLMSLVRALAPADKTALLVDFGARSTDIAIARNGVLTFSRSIPTAGEAFTRAVAQAMGVSAQQAEEYKRSYGLSEERLEGKIKQAVGPVFRVVADEMKKAIHFYQAEEKGESPQLAILSGGSAGMPHAASSLTQLLNIEVVVGNPFSNIKVDPEAIKNLSGYAPFYSIAVGLAKRKI